MASAGDRYFGIGMLTPAMVHFGQVPIVLAHSGKPSSTPPSIQDSSGTLRGMREVKDFKQVKDFKLRSILALLSE
jgi:hypothetical protein